MLSGPYGRLLCARFGQTPQDEAVTVDLGADPEESYWVVEVIPAVAALPLARAPPCCAQSCDARLEATMPSDTASSAFLRFYSAKRIAPEEGEIRESDGRRRCRRLGWSWIPPAAARLLPRYRLNYHLLQGSPLSTIHYDSCGHVQDLAGDLAKLVCFSRHY